MDFFQIPLSDPSAVAYESHSFRSKLFDQNFFKSLTKITSAYSTSHPEAADAVITLVLPDFLFSTDTFSVPTLKKKKMDSALDVMIETMYKNRKELQIHTDTALAGKKVTVYSVVAFNNSFRSSFVSACSAGKMTPDCITFRSAAFGNAVSVVDSKYTASSYLMLDIRPSDATFVFVSKGRATGYYQLPFGYKVLQRASVAAENLLFDHDSAELVVLNAKEKAKAKQLTIMRNNNPDENGDVPEDQQNASVDPTASAVVDTSVKELPRKVARVVPKFMQRPAPKTQEETAYENFTLFMKWALNLIESNDKLTAIGNPETVLVNIPAELSHVIDTANEEKDESGITFTRLNTDAESETVREHIDLLGGLYAPTMHKINNF